MRLAGAQTSVLAYRSVQVALGRVVCTLTVAALFLVVRQRQRCHTVHVTDVNDHVNH